MVIEVDYLHTSPQTEERLTKDDCGELEIWPTVYFLCTSGWSYTYKHIGNTTWTLLLIKIKKAHQIGMYIYWESKAEGKG